MTCKDCLHYEACDRLADAALDYGIMQIRTCVCKCFSDKSEWVHLVDEDCEMAYYAVGNGNDIFVEDEPINGMGIKDGKQCVVDYFGDFYKIGETVFLTEEEAQKEIERRRKIND